MGVSKRSKLWLIVAGSLAYGLFAVVLVVFVHSVRPDTKEHTDTRKLIESELEAYEGVSLHRNDYGDITGISSNLPHFGDEQLKQFAEVIDPSSIESIAIITSSVTDAGLKELPLMANLAYLALDDSQVSDSGVTLIPGFAPNVDTLTLSGTHVSGKSVTALGDLADLEFLDVSRTVFNREDAGRLNSKLTDVEIEYR